MDMNLVVISGLLAAPPELRTLDSGAVIARYLLTTRTDEPRRRVDVVPVTQWNPPSEASTYASGSRLCAVGSIQRRFWDAADGRRGRLEIVASQIVDERAQLDIPACDPAKNTETSS